VCEKALKVFKVYPYRVKRGDLKVVVDLKCCQRFKMLNVLFIGLTRTNFLVEKFQCSPSFKRLHGILLEIIVA